MKYAIFVFLVLFNWSAYADQLQCVTTYKQMIGNDFKTCVERIEDPLIKNVVCYISHAITGGIGGSIGIGSDPSRFAISCNQIGSITLPINSLNSDEIFKMNTSVLFKDIKVSRYYDKDSNVLIYLLYNINKLNNSPHNSISTVPILSWNH